MLLRLLAFVLPLGVDSFAVAAALGAAGLTSISARLRVSLIFVVFEAGMPLIGLAAGGGIARAIGSVADYLAASAVIALGVFMLVARHDDDEQKASRITSTHGLAIIALGVSISLDELAIGFGAGLLRLQIPALVIAVAAQAFIVTQIGIRLGDRVGERLREGAENVAGLALIALGVILLITLTA